jgi:hypothetical protein
MGVICGLTGFGILASLDVPLIRHGGYGAGLAAFELILAVGVIGTALGLAGRDW